MRRLKMVTAPVKQSLVIEGPAGRLEALLETPVGADESRIAVVCHPHPQFQGTMLNKVVHTLARAVNDCGIPALRFNFRGVGASQGSYADGDGEVGDVLAATKYVAQNWPDAQLILAGFSFGGVVAARAAADVEPEYLISVAPAVNILGSKLGQTPQVPWLIVQGDADDVVPPDSVISWVDTLNPRPELVILPGVGHFFHGHLVDLRTLIVNRIRQL
jgi:alpha/beta superfamily hydrolase